MVSFLHCPQQPPINQEEAFPKMVQDAVSKIEIKGGVEKSAAKKRRVRKNLFPCNETSSSEPSHQLQHEEKCQKLVNSATNKSYDNAVSDTLSSMPSESQTFRITARDVKAKALLLLQSHRVGDVIRTVKNVGKGGVIIDALDLEMEEDESSESVTQNVEVRDGKVQAGEPSSRNFVDVSEKPRQTHGQELVPGPACISSYKKSHKITNKHVGVKKSDTRENVKQATGFPVLTPHSSQVCETHVFKSESITATNCPSGSSSNTDYKAPSRCVCKGQKNKTLRQSLGNVQAEADIICISDDSDDEIEWLCSKYNPKLDYELGRKKQAVKKHGQSAVETEGNLTPKQTHISPKSDPCVQRNIRTCGMGAASSTGSSVTTLPNQVQTLNTNPNNNTTYLTHNSTILHDQVEEKFPVMHNHVGTRTVAENQDSVSEALLTVQPSGSSYSVSGNCVLQTESIERVQSHIPGLSTAKTVLSPILPYSIQNNQNVPLRTQVTLTPKQTHDSPKSNPCVQRVVPTPEMEAAASTGISVTTLPNQSQTLLTNSNNNTYLTHNSTILHDKVQEDFLVKHNHVGTRTVEENEDSVSEAVLTVQPSGSSYSVSGNCVLQTESIEHVQRHITGQSTANTILSPHPLSSPQNNPNIHHPVAAGETITTVQHSSSMSNGPVHNLQINVGSQNVPSHVRASQGSNIHPYIFILGSSPGTSVIQVTTDSTNRPSHACPQDISSDAQLVRTNSPSFNSSTSSSIPYPQLPQARIPTPQLVDPLVDRARNCHLPVYQTNNLPVAVRSSHLPSVQTRNPGFPSTPTERPPTHHPHSLLANIRVPGIHLSSHTPEGQTRIPGTPLMKTRNSVTAAVQTRSPGTPVAHASSAGTVHGKTRSPGTLVAHTSSAGTVLGQTRSPGTPVAHTSSAGTVLGQTRSPGTPVAHTSSSGIVLGKTSGPGTPVAHTSSSGIVLGKTRSPGTPVAHTSSSGIVLGKTSPGTPVARALNSGLSKTSPGKICFSQASSSGVSVVQGRNSGSLFRAQTPVAHVNSGTRLPHGRGHPGSRPEREWTDVQQRDQTARLVVIPGDDNISRYGLVFPSGAKVILTPEQVAEIRAANGGLLTSNFGM
jgi:hypothetical protein